jgi:hypothetical protein
MRHGLDCLAMRVRPSTSTHSRTPTSKGHSE